MPLRRTSLGVACILLGALLLLAGALLADASRLLRADSFADRVAASLGDPRVAAFAAEHVTEAVIAQRRDLTAVRPLILAASGDVVRSGAFRGLVRTAAHRAHAALFSSFGRSVVLSIPDLEIVLRGALAGSPAVAQAVPQSMTVGLAGVASHPAMRAALGTVRLGLALAPYVWPALALGALLVIGGVLLMKDRRDACVAAGAALIVVGLTLWAIPSVGETIVARTIDSPRVSGALAGLSSVALAGVPRWGLVYGIMGVVLAAAGSTLLERLDLPELTGRAARLLVARHERRRARLARGATLAAVGILALVAPGATLAALAAVGGFLLAFIGLRELFSVAFHAAPRHERLTRAMADTGEGWVIGGALGAVLAGLLATGIVVASRGDEEQVAPTAIDACNGAAELCDRRLDDVTFAGTHNAMAAADVSTWLFPQQERGIRAQLEDGVRALLLDVHRGTPVGDRVRTDLAAGGRRADAERALGAEGVAAAMRIRDRLVGGEARAPGLFLCHGFCELGALPLDSVLRDVRAFLDANPHEVIVLVIEDYVPPADLARAFEASGLASLAWRGRPGARWPTLREMIERDERVVALLESGRGGVAWLMPAFTVLQETPYTFRSATDTLSCAPNRGGITGTLFQLNHWIETTPAPRPTNAAVVNALPVLVERARRCEQARGARPNIIAVDFYRTGDLLRAVRVLNGLEELR